MNRSIIGYLVAIVLAGEAQASVKCNVNVHVPATLKRQKFSDLDAYLAYLKSQGPRDVAFYDRQANGIYRLVTRDRRMKKFWTRAELLVKYGFTC